MQPISAPTLMISVQALAAEIRLLTEEIAAAESDADRADLQELLVTYEKAAEELRDAYIAESRTTLNLISYEELVGPDES